MALVFDQSVVRIQPTHSRWPFVSSPFFIYTDFPWKSGAAMMAQNATDPGTGVGPLRPGFVFDEELQCVYPAPIYVPHDNCYRIALTRAANYPGRTPSMVTYPQAIVYQWTLTGDLTALHSTQIEHYQIPSASGLAWTPPVAQWIPTSNNTRMISFGPNPLLKFIEFIVPNFQNSNGYISGLDANNNLDVQSDFTGTIVGKNFEVEWFGATQGMWFLFAGSQHTVAAEQGNGSGNWIPQQNTDFLLPGIPTPPYVGNPPTQPDDMGAKLKFTIGVGSGHDQVLYKLEWQAGHDPTIAKQFPGDTGWTHLQVVPVSSEVLRAFGADPMLIPPVGGWNGNSKTAGGGSGGTGGTGDQTDNDTGLIDEYSAMNTYPDRYQRIDFRLIAGRLAVRVGNNAQAYFFDEARVDSNGQAIFQITYAKMWANSGFRELHISGHPLKFTQTGYYDSQDITSGFYSRKVLTPFIEAAGAVPGGWDAEIDPNFSNLLGPICNYRMVMTGPFSRMYKGVPYSDSGAAIRAVHLIWGSVEDFSPGPAVQVVPEAIEEITHRLDIAKLQIHSNGSIAFNNNKPLITPSGVKEFWSQWALNTGQIAADVAITRTKPDGSYGPLTEIFCGYGKVRDEIDLSTGGRGTYRMFLADRSRQLMTDEFALPWMDGWNVFYAIGYLAQLGGVSIRNMGFAGLVPNEPFGPGTDLGDGLGGKAYYLSVGAAGSALTRFSGDYLWDIMGRIAYSIGYLLFFDVYGVLQFVKFRVPAGGIVKRTFWDSDQESAALGGLGAGLEGCWSVDVLKDMDEVRSDAIVIGVNAFAPQWDPIVMKQEDQNIIYNSNVYNHLGYKRSAVWMDSLFADPQFAYQADLEMFYFLRTPGLYVNFTTWSQPDIYPLDLVAVMSSRAGTWGVPLLVTSVTHRGTKDRYQSTITARYLPMLSPVLQ